MKHQILGAGLLLAMCAAPAAQAQISLVNPVPQEVKSAGKQLMSLPGKWTLKAMPHASMLSRHSVRSMPPFHKR